MALINHVSSLSTTSPLILLSLPLTLLVIAACFYEQRRKSYRIHGFPQAPGLPILGNVLVKNIAEQCRLWQYSYGAVFQVQLGEIPIIFVNSAAAAKAIFTGHSNALNSRPNLRTFHEIISENVGGTIGTTSNNYALQRGRKDATVTKSAVEQYLKYLDIETKDFIRQCFDAGEQPIDPLRLLQRMSLSLDFTLCWGRRVLLTDPLLPEVVETEHQIVEIRNMKTNYQDCLPFLRLPFSTTTKRARQIRQRRDTYYNALNAELDERMKINPNHSGIRASLIRSNASEEELNLMCVTMIAAGLAPTVATLQWSLAFLATRPDIQAEAYQAIQKHYGRDLPLGELEDDQGCAYITSFAKECLRYFVPARCALPRSTAKEFSYNKTIIPAGTTIFLNAWACNMDPTIHSSPTDFDPCRFMPPTSTSGTKTTPWTSPPLFTFGIGSRSCTGTVLTYRLLYIFFIRLFSAFEILPFEKVDVDPVTGCANLRTLVNSPKNYRVVFRARNGRSLAEALSKED